MTRPKALSRLIPSRIRHSFRAKIFSAFLLLGMLASTDSVYFIGKLLYRVELAEARSLMFATVVQMAESVDPADVQALSDAQDPLSREEYSKVRGQLTGQLDAIVQALDDRNENQDIDASSVDSVVTDLYILGRTDEPGIGRLLVTLNQEETNRLYDMSRFPVMMEAWTFAQTEREAATDEYGTTLSAYAPIRDANGQTIAIVGIDTAGGYYRNIIVFVVVLAVLMFFGGVLFSVLFAWILSRVLSTSLKNLAGAIEQVAAGNLNVSVEESFTSDEFGLLSHRFNEMVRGLRDRASIKQDLGQAATIQAGLLPSEPPIVDNFELSGGIRYSQETGGDYFDFIDIETEQGTRVGIVVGDVTGHGIASALMMCSCRAVFRALAHGAEENASALLRAVNNSLVQEFQLGKFITTFYGVLIPEERRLEWANAGHEPGLLIRGESGEVEYLKSSDIPLGIAPDRTFPAGQTVVFEPGDTLIIGTDGISQARDNSDEFFGFERVVEIVRRNRNATAEQIRDAILRSAQDHEGDENLEDDATLVVVRCHPNTAQHERLK